MMDAGARRWLIKTAQKNYWRVHHWVDLDDLIQEGYVAWYRTCAKYPSATDIPNRMALFKRVYLNRLHDLANKRTRSIPEVCFTDLEFERDQRIGAHETRPKRSEIAAELGLDEVRGVSGAPQYVRDALALFADESDLARLRSRYRKVRTGGRWLRRETLNERLCRLTGYDPDQTDIVGGIKACLGER